MVRVAPVRLAFNPRTLWFDPRDLEIKKDQPVVVLTARGVEFGVAADNIIEVADEEIAKLKTPLKPVKRVATEEDVQRAAEMERLSAEALPIFREMAEEAEVEMRPISVEYLLEGDKAVFYFEAEERVDFRDLVRQLASRFHVRIDMRQIGVRDEARMVGGLGHCGQELCCKRLGGELCPVSIRMAKEQDLSLNPQKISGVCGRLMCCLRYEFDAYKDFKSRAPKANATVQTPDGPAKVVGLDVPREVVSVCIEGEKPVKVPLADFEPAEEGKRPNVIGAEAWQAALDAGNLAIVGDTTFLTSQFTQADKLASAGAVRRTGSQSGAAGGARAKKAADEDAAARKPRRRRSTKVSSDAGEATSRDTQKKGAKASDDSNKNAGANGGAPKKRSSRTRSKQQDGRVQDASKQDRAKNTNKTAGAQGGASGVRPGQKSSGLRRAGEEKRANDNLLPSRKPRRAPQAHGEGGAPDSKASGNAAGGNNHRRARRRSHTTGGNSEKGRTE